MVEMALESRNRIVNVPVDKVRPNPYQPRKIFESVGLNELAASIKECGVLQPINVRMFSDYAYELVSGERRLRAAKLAGLAYIPAIIVDIDEQQSAVYAIIENLQRQDLNFVEEAEGFRNLITDYSLTQEELAVKLGKTQSTVANKLRILKLPKNILEKILENGLSERHARALLKISDEKVLDELVTKAIKQGLNVKKTEELVEAYLTKEDEADKFHGKVNYHIKDVRIFVNTIKQAVDIMNSSGIEAIYEKSDLDNGFEITVLVNY